MVLINIQNFKPKHQTFCLSKKFNKNESSFFELLLEKWTHKRHNEEIKAIHGATTVDNLTEVWTLDSCGALQNLAIHHQHF